MRALDLARWQFAIVTVYHFIFVPLTIGLSVLVAGMQTAWFRTKNPVYLRMTKFWGKLMLINFAIGVATGIVQEFQFGMNWSAYSRFVGDIFGAPLAMEGLIAFFMESTFLGIWIFGWDRLSPRLHLASIWLAAIGTNVSAFFILAANSWMQNPVGFRFNTERGRAELTDIFAVLTNKVALVTIPHTIAGAFLSAALFVVGVSAWHLLRCNETELFEKSARMGLIVGVVAAVATAGVGHVQAQVMTSVQPMKMAAAEALWDTTKGADFSLFAYGDVSKGQNKIDVGVPGGLSALAHNDANSTVEGINDVNASEQARYGPGDYRPVIPLAYWSFRLMVGLGVVLTAFCMVGLWFTRRGGLLQHRRFLLWSVPVMCLPFAANSIGWIFTETARQPWVVYGILRTRDAVSPTVPAGSVLTTLVGFTALYAVLAVIEFRLMYRYAAAGPPQLETEASADDVQRPPALVY